MSTYDSDGAASEKLEKVDSRLTPPESPIPQITRASSSSPETVESRGSKASHTSKDSWPRRKTLKRKKRKIKHGQGDVTLFRSFAPDYPELIKGAGIRTFDLGSSGEDEPEEVMDGGVQVPAPGPTIGYTPHAGISNIAMVGAASTVASVVGASNLAMSSTPVKRQYGEVKGPGPNFTGPVSTRRSDSGGSLEMDRRRALQRKPLTLSTSTSDPTGRMRDAVAADGLLKLSSRNSPRRPAANQDSIATSPILQQHLISPAQAAPEQKLPAMTADSPRGLEPSSSPNQAVHLPPVSDLFQVAEKTTERRRTDSYSSVSTMSGLSPTLGVRTLPQPLQSPFQPMNPLSRTSTGGSLDARSPAESASDMPADLSRIVPDRRPYHQRRVVPAAGQSRPPFLSNHAGTSSSSKSVASTSVNTNSSTSTNTSTEAYSPDTRTTPSDNLTSGDDTPQSSTGAQHSATYLHYPGVPIGGYRCQHDGCDAAPFSTQYLLNSHANVHSQDRPHYCSVQGCPRAKGGRGFKRKNEMIRHGLVHESPGYVCPWCPDREHRYPRPDNLQRHVRMHHDDKDKDDPKLLEVLSQRASGGTTRGRKRRN